MKEVLVLLVMLFMHFIDDIYLPNLKVRLKNELFTKEDDDAGLSIFGYDILLMIHGYIWACMVILPILIYLDFKIELWIVFMIICHSVTHGVIDYFHEKKHIINFKQDQLCHLVQIVTIWLTFVIIQI